MKKIKYLDSLSAEKYNELKKKLYEIQNGKCFICEEEIDLDLANTDIDHIKPLANGGKDDENNFAITHSSCNREKQDADLQLAKILKKLEKIKEYSSEKQEKFSLKQVLEKNGGAKFNFKYKIENNRFKYSFSDIGDEKLYDSEIFTDKLSQEQSVFIEVPIEYLYHDEIINPRGINSSISLLIKEFYIGNPQLHLSLARICDNKICIFDGQHKAVAQIMLGVRKLVVRLFIAPNYDRLVDTNTNAGSKLKQIAFDKAIVRELHSKLYAERIKQYQRDHNMSEDCYSFSEKDLVDYFKGQKRKIGTYIINNQKDMITHNTDNKLRSYSTFEKTILSTFINSKTILSTVLDYKIEEGLNPRNLEIKQIVRLCNIITDEALYEKYDVEIGIHKIENKIASGKGSNINDAHIIACRLFREDIMFNWVKYIELVINQYYANMGIKYDRDNLFQKLFDEQLWKNISNFVNNLVNLPFWKNKQFSETIFSAKRNYDFWDKIFTTGSSPDGIKVLSKPLNIIDMIVD